VLDERFKRSIIDRRPPGIEILRQTCSTKFTLP
jgi:hypothetical protein